MNVVEMTTNDEIREQENMQMAHYESLTTAEQADRERSLMNKARADTTKRIFREIDKIVGRQAESIIGLDAKKYAKLKKRYKVD